MACSEGEAEMQQIILLSSNQALLAAGIYYAICVLSKFYAHSFLTRPIVVCPILGLAFGNLQQGLLLGATLELSYTLWAYAFEFIAPDALIAAAIVTPFCILTETDLYFAASFSHFVFTLTAFFVSGIRVSLTEPFIHCWLDRLKKEGNAKTYRISVIIYEVLFPILTAGVVFCALFWGREMIEQILNAVPPFLLKGMYITAGALPVVGIAAMMNALWNRRFLLFILFGFAIPLVFGVYMDAVLVVAIFIVTLYFLYQMEVWKLFSKRTPSNHQEEGGNMATQVSPLDVTQAAVQREGIPISPPYAAQWNARMFRKVFFSFTLFSGMGYSYSRLMEVGFSLGLLPWLKALYQGDKEGLVEAWDRQQFFNGNPETTYFILGLTCALEGQYRDTKQASIPKAIHGAKAALMGPFTMVGDTLFWMVLRTVAAIVAISLAKEGNPFAPFVFLLLYHGVSAPFRWFALRWGYRVGARLTTTEKYSEVLHSLLPAIAMVGAIMVGSLAASYVKLPVSGFLFGSYDQEGYVTIQGVLDAIFPKLLPLLLTLFCARLLRKGLKPIWLILLLILLAMTGTVLGIFGEGMYWR